MLGLRYCGSVKRLLVALRGARRMCLDAGPLARDEINRRRFQKRLRQAEIDSILDEILGHRPSGDAA